MFRTYPRVSPFNREIAFVSNTFSYVLMLFSDEHRTSRRAVLNRATQILQDAGIEDAQRNAEWLLMELLGCSRATLYAFGEEAVEAEIVARLEAYIQRRLQHEPLQYILGYTEFFGLRIGVTPAVLIPRPETEQVVEAALECMQQIPAPRVLDIGTGSGCIPLAVKHEHRKADVYGCDVSPGALGLARANAEAVELDITLFKADVQAARFIEQAPKELDVVISNPPYVPDTEAVTLAPEVADHEPHIALFSGVDPLHFYRIIARRGVQLLKLGGWLVFETHTDYGEAVRDLVRELGYTSVVLQHDLAGHPRIVLGQRATGSPS